MDKICGIYKITSPTGKIYIGQSRDINRRKSEHKNKTKNDSTILGKSISKYGWVAHIFEILMVCDESALNYHERIYINEHDSYHDNNPNGMNLTEGGDYTQMSEITKLKMKETRNKNNIWLGRKHSEESKRKMRESAKGNKNHYGKKHSEESKRKMSESAKGRVMSDETKEKIGKSSKGRIHSEETRNKISEGNKGKRTFGRVWSDESRRKISETKKSRNYAHHYEIYDNNDKLIYKFHGNVKETLKSFNYPRDKFCDSYKHNTKISHKIYDGWYMIRTD